ncbi:DELTA-stichotoxin-Hcr4a-like [Misgurnus anguillicaudatus]|uniref:DELTA-stichotoxin-Hcr4a-like n=1 Tax=Misgurnus anguillicaudatus TaxID=75329 RepID=UPI003CCF7118
MQTADSVSANIDRIRSCTIEINNMSEAYSLNNPKFYMCSGCCWHPPQPTISFKNIGVCAFTKIAFTAFGAVGVLTYDLCLENQECTDRMAILFSVPFNGLYNNTFGVGVISTDRVCNEAMYEKMYYENDNSFIRGKAKDGGITYNAQRVKLEATMSNAGKAIIKVEIYDRLR